MGADGRGSGARQEELSQAPRLTQAEGIEDQFPASSQGSHRCALWTGSRQRKCCRASTLRPAHLHTRADRCALESCVSCVPWLILAGLYTVRMDYLKPWTLGCYVWISMDTSRSSAGVGMRLAGTGAPELAYVPATRRAHT